MEKIKTWVLLSVLLLLPSGVFALALIEPAARPIAIQFAQVAFGSVIGTLSGTPKGRGKRKLPSTSDENEGNE